MASEVGSKFEVEILEDGTIKINARGMIGDEAELVAEMEALAKEVGGELKVEKHEPGTHHHHHGTGKNRISHKH